MMRILMMVPRKYLSQYDDDYNDLYTVDQINAYLDETKGKTVPLEQYFPDLNKFMMSVMKARKTVGYDVLSKQKHFRLKKRLTARQLGIRGNRL